VTSETICYRCVSLVGLPDVVILDVEDVPGGALRVHVELTRSRQGCPTCGVIAHVKDRRRVELVDLSMAGRPMRLVWVKRRFRCPEPSCPTGSWTEDEPRIASQRLMMTDRAGRSWPAGTRPDAIVLLGPAAIRAVGVGTPPAPLVPDQPRALAEARQIDERHDPLVLQMRPHPTLGASRPRRSTLDVDLEHRTTVVDAEHIDIGEADEDLADACWILFDRRAEDSRASHAVRLTVASPRARDVVPRHFRSTTKPRTGQNLHQTQDESDSFLEQ
jgi:hypothetical protein